MTEMALEELVSILSSVDDVVKLLPQEEQDVYRRCQESVIDARRSAQENEGRIVIGITHGDH